MFGANNVGVARTCGYVARIMLASRELVESGANNVGVARTSGYVGRIILTSRELVGMWGG